MFMSSCTFLQPTPSRPAPHAPHRTAWHHAPSRPVSLPARTDHDICRRDCRSITLLEASPHHGSHGLGARGAAWHVASLAWGPGAGVWELDGEADT